MQQPRSVHPRRTHRAQGCQLCTRMKVCGTHQVHAWTVYCTCIMSRGAIQGHVTRPAQAMCVPRAPYITCATTA